VLCPVVCGRDDELRVLRDAFARAAAGHGGVAFITGEPGIGKSRLIRWLGADAGLVIVLEDLHWADPDTLALLEYLADNLGGERVLCVATSRDEPDTAVRAGDTARAGRLLAASGEAALDRGALASGPAACQRIARP
jgi:predicted ATPase